MENETESSRSRGRPRLIVGVDYGTTYSGISFAISTATSFQEIYKWTAYPGAASHISEHCEKAPSWIAFANENDDLDSDAWGYQVESGMKTYAWTKLLLDDSALPTEYDDPSLRGAADIGILKLPRGMTAKDVATEYLRGMNRMFQSMVEEKYGEKNLKDLPIDVWITVPATWTEKAKLLTKAAALDAGFASRPGDRLMLIPEPEAAAHMALKTSIDNVQDLVEVGAGIMVCDLGGGTVDITSYEVLKTAPKLRLKELAVGAGGKCGGTFVDRNFYKLMEKRFGTAFTSLGSRMTGPGSHFMNQFELKKRDFSMKIPSRRTTRLALNMGRSLRMTPELKPYYEENFGYVLLTQEDMKSLFDPVVNMIIELISGQVDQVQQNGKAIDTLILVGGFGSSPYLKEVLQKWCDARQAPMRLTSPLNGAWSAVVCGAVLRGIEGSIAIEKKCRRHYGFSVCTRFDPDDPEEYDAAQREVWQDKFEGYHWLTGSFSWLINKNAILDENTRVYDSFTKYITLPLSQHYYTRLYAYSQDQVPKNVEDGGIETVGKIKYRLDDIDLTKIEKKVCASGKVMYRTSLQVEIRMSDEAGLLAFSILHEGKVCGTAKLGFSYAWNDSHEADFTGQEGDF